MQSCRGVEGPKKHRCPDCTFCQWCSDTRCAACRRERCCRAGKAAGRETVKKKKKQAGKKAVKNIVKKKKR